MFKENSNVILVVDDNSTNIKVLFTFLKESGFKVLIASSGEVALQRTQEVFPDLILLDIMMPEMDGFETCRRLKANPQTQDIPVIFITALSDIENKVYGLTMGAVDYITKPFHKEEVLSRVRLHLKLNSLSRTLQDQNQQLTREIQARTAAETALLQLTQTLEERVIQRTTELSEALQNLKSREEQLFYAAYHDSLTDLPNRHWFMNYLVEVINQTSNSSVLNFSHPQEKCLNKTHLYAVLFIDLDRFKVVNDSLGHLIGDKLLQQVSERLKGCLTQHGTLARLGGDEFIILLENLRFIEEAEMIAQYIIRQLKQPFEVDSYQVVTGASIGIAPSSMNYQDAMEILRDADIAMYQAKAAGKGCYVLLTPEMRAAAFTRLEIESELRLAIERNEFCLYYQPIISLITNHLVGFEALIRWNHPIKGMINPCKFIEIAEEVGFIQRIDDWALQTACLQLKQWLEQFPSIPYLTMNVNLSAGQISHPNLVKRLQAICHQTSILPTCLKLEITESCFIKSSTEEISNLKKIQDQGIGLCIDDFGTGYSSLSRLHSFPISTLKIDRAFVSQMNSSPTGEGMIKTIINLAHHLEMNVVAEGIETREQLEKLKLLGCDLGQGFLFSRPLDAERMSHFLETYLPILA